MLKTHLKVLPIGKTKWDECWETASWTETQTVKRVVGLHSGIAASCSAGTESSISNDDTTGLSLAQNTFLHDNNNNGNNCKA